MKLTSKGRDLLLAALAEALLTLVFRDPLIAAATLAMLALLAADALTAYRQASRDAGALSQCRLSTRSLKLLAGSSRVLRAELPNPVRSQVTAEPEWVGVRAAGTSLYLHLAPRIFGEASVRLKLLARSRLGFWEHAAATNPLFSVLVLPKATPLLLQALASLVGGAGEASGEEKRASSFQRGLEYRGSRRYQPGDRLKSIDWPATTRLQELIVRDYRAGEGSAVVAVNLDAPSPSVLDFTVSAMLSAALAAAREGVGTSLLRIEGGSAELTPRLDARSALALAVKLALEKLKLSFEALEQILPEPSSELANLAEELGALSLKEVFAERAREASRITRNLEKGALLLLCGPLTSNVQLIIDLVHSASARARVIIVTHPKPWADAKTPEEAKAIRETHERVVTLLVKRFRVHTRPTAAGREVALHALALRARAQ
ncbi:MAG: DUF58 domain-containing protein [Thermofilum sp.]